MRTLRIVILSRGYCDLRCSFCHQEGLALARQRGERAVPSPADLLALVRSGRRVGVDSLTFSGGEPMIEWPELKELLAVVPLGFLVTVVTNGHRLAELGDWSRESGRNLVVHLNLPTVDETCYRSLVGGPQGRLGHVLADVERAIDHGVTVDVNCVICPARNDDIRSLDRLFAWCQGVGVRRLRLLEDGSAEGPGTQLDLANLPGWSAQAQRWYTEGRERVFHAGKYGRLHVEFVRCDSRLRGLRDDADLYFWPPRSVRLGLVGPTRTLRALDRLDEVVREWHSTSLVSNK